MEKKIFFLIIVASAFLLFPLVADVAPYCPSPGIYPSCTIDQNVCGTGNQIIECDYGVVSFSCVLISETPGPIDCDDCNQCGKPLGPYCAAEWYSSSYYTYTCFAGQCVHDGGKCNLAEGCLGANCDAANPCNDYCSGKWLTTGGSCTLGDCQCQYSSQIDCTVAVGSTAGYCCDLSCINKNWDNNNCGGCGNACFAPTSECNWGVCSECNGDEDCGGGEICCGGSCSVPVCESDLDCPVDGNFCTADTCSNPGTCSAVCSYTPKPAGTPSPGEGDCRECDGAGAFQNVPDGTNDCGTGCQRCLSGFCQDYDTVCTASCSNPYLINYDCLSDSCTGSRCDTACGASCTPAVPTQACGSGDCAGGTQTCQANCQWNACSTQGNTCNLCGQCDANGSCTGFEPFGFTCGTTNCPVGSSGSPCNKTCDGSGNCQDCTPSCIETNCTDGTDNDNDDSIDCLDSDCCSTAVCAGQAGPGGVTCCQSISNCGTCQDCSSNVCVNVSLNEGQGCTGECTQCINGSCVNRGQCSSTECPVSGTYCNGLGGSCWDPDNNSSLCNVCAPGSEIWTWEIGGGCCGDDGADDDWCVAGGGSCIDGIYNTNHCSDGIQNCDETAVDVGGSCNAAPTCLINLREQGTTNPIIQININDFFDIYAGGCSDDTAITEVRFLSDENQNGAVDTGFTWTSWYSWTVSSGDWNAISKVKPWSFSTASSKEVWLEVKDGQGLTSQCSANITTIDPCQPPATGDWLIPASVTCVLVDEIHTITGNLEVRGILDLQGTTNIQFETSAKRYIYVYPGGKIYQSGTAGFNK